MESNEQQLHLPCFRQLSQSDHCTYNTMSPTKPNCYQQTLPDYYAIPITPYYGSAYHVFFLILQLLSKLGSWSINEPFNATSFNFSDRLLTLNKNGFSPLFDASMSIDDKNNSIYMLTVSCNKSSSRLNVNFPWTIMANNSLKL